MKLSKAALLLFLSAPASNAFTPATKTFGITRTHHGLQSTTVKNNVDLTINVANVIKKTAPPKEDKGHPLKSDIKSATRDYLKQYEGMPGAGVVYSKLEEYGVKVVNGYSGGAVLPLLDQFHEDHPRHKANPEKRIRWITNSNESSAGHVAEGYAKSMPLDSRNPPVGVVVATSGPGLTNLITPLQDAICDGVPMVVMCGQAATVAPPDAFQSSPAVALTTPCTKWSYQIRSAAEVPFVMDYAFFVARNGRPGPVFIDLPKDLQIQELTSELIDSFLESNLSTTGDDAPFWRTVVEKRPSGEAYQAVRLGTPEKGLTFGYREMKDKSIKLSPVTESRYHDNFHADHHVTNRVYKTEPSIDGKDPVSTTGPLEPSSLITKEILSLLRVAKKPVIIAGQGCNDSSEELKEFAEKLQIPVTTTLHALGCFDERHPLALNMVGMHGHPTPNYMVQDADLIICIGSRFDDRITGRMSDFAPEARRAAEELRGGIIHVDIRLTERNKQLVPTYFVHSTGKHFLKTMNEVLTKRNNIITRTGPWLEKMAELQKTFPVIIPHFKTQKVHYVDDNGHEHMLPRTKMSTQSVIKELNDQLLAANKIEETLFTTGVGVHQMVAAQLVTWTTPRQMMSSGSLGTMGVALGYSIGAQLANGKKIVIAIDGDGSFNMTFTELKTVAEQGIPVKLLILDNESQMMVEYWQRLFQDSRFLAVRNSRNPDYCMLAEAFGIKNLYCDNEEELEGVMKEFLFSDPGKPVLFHARVQRTPCLPLVAPGQPLDNMILEDVTPEVDPNAAPS